MVTRRRKMIMIGDEEKEVEEYKDEEQDTLH